MKARRLLPDGSYERVRGDGKTAIRSQQRFMELARDKAQAPALPAQAQGGFLVRTPAPTGTGGRTGGGASGTGVPGSTPNTSAA